MTGSLRAYFVLGSTDEGVQPNTYLQTMKVQIFQLGCHCDGTEFRRSPSSIRSCMQLIAPVTSGSKGCALALRSLLLATNCDYDAEMNFNRNNFHSQQPPCRILDPVEMDPLKRALKLLWLHSCRSKGRKCFLTAFLITWSFAPLCVEAPGLHNNRRNL